MLLFALRYNEFQTGMQACADSSFTPQVPKRVEFAPPLVKSILRATSPGAAKAPATKAPQRADVAARLPARVLPAGRLSGHTSQVRACERCASDTPKV
jgi:hypothetical protein